MRVIFKFEKEELVRYVSHLDMLRAMQRTLSRSGLPVAFSQGFHPHQLVAFAMPLPVGATSRGEYMDVVFREDRPVEELLEKLASALPPGWKLVGAQETSASAPALMAMTAQCDWQIDFPEMDIAAARARVQEIMDATEVMVMKSMPKGPAKEVNVREGVIALQAEEMAAGSRITVRLAAGSKLNIGPALFSEAMSPGCDPRLLPMHRLELYGMDGGRPLPLLELAARYNK